MIAPNVRLRFALDAATFADRLLDLAHRAPSGPADRPGEHIRRLSLDDLYLATACSQGDEGAWDELTARYLGFMRNFARRFLGEPAATDLADKVVANLWQKGKIARYEGRSTLQTWLGAVVAHAALNAAKANHHPVPLEGEKHSGGHPAPPAPEPAADEARSLLTRLVAEAMGGLPPRDRLLLYLYYEQDLTLGQMAVTLHASKATLSRRLAQVRAALRASIESLARWRAGASADALRAGIDLGRLELDLGDLLGRAARNETDLVLSKNGECIQPEHEDPSSC
jgi:RNA polymerase sigma-70 factor